MGAGGTLPAGAGMGGGFGSSPDLTGRYLGAGAGMGGGSICRASSRTHMTIRCSSNPLPNNGRRSRSSSRSSMSPRARS